MENIHYERTLDLWKKMKEENIDGLFVNITRDVYYVTGFHQDGAFLLVTKDDIIAFLPKMFVDHFKEICNWAKIVIYENILNDVNNKAKELKLKNVYFDSTTLTYDKAKILVGYGFKDKENVFKDFRMVKKGEELASLKKACEIAARAFKMFKPRIKTGMKEIEVARELEYMMQKLGASTRSFDTIVGFGANAAMPHHESSERKLKKNECVLIDFGCIYNRYCSDITRTFFNGKPDPEFLKVYSIVERAHDAGIAAVKEGVLAFDVDKAARDLISSEGYGQYFTHTTGHGVGLEIHEEPAVSTKSKETLKEGMIITVEPGIYLYGKFGIRIEDTVCVTKKGAQVLTKI
jgi:Xaa-Pro aminopeptidase